LEDEHDNQVGDEKMKMSKLEATQASTVEDGLSKLARQLEAEKKRSEDYLSKLKYLQADFENYRKRVDREIQEVEEFSVTKVIRKLLPVIDELELAIGSVENNSANNQVLEGVKMVHKKVLSALEAEGLKRIDALGKPFDPELHEASEKVEGNGPTDKVVEVIRSGYTLKGRVLRPSLVKVELAAKQQEEKRESGAREESERA
jgi:molecular chaperone GrpE